jgi:thiol-disulfide isomerase/thioredoxin
VSRAAAVLLLLVACCSWPVEARGAPYSTSHERQATSSALQPIDEAGYLRLLAAGKGQVLLVDFWATWCIPCREEMPKLVELAARNRGLKLVTVSCDEPEQEAGASAFLARFAVKPPHYIKRVKDDEQFIDVIDSKWSGALPALFLYDRQGRLVKSYVGETDMAALQAALRKLL